MTLFSSHPVIRRFLQSFAGNHEEEIKAIKYAVLITLFLLETEGIRVNKLSADELKQILFATAKHYHIDHREDYKNEESRNTMRQNHDDWLQRWRKRNQKLLSPPQFDRPDKKKVISLPSVPLVLSSPHTISRLHEYARSTLDKFRLRSNLNILEKCVVNCCAQILDSSTRSRPVPLKVVDHVQTPNSDSNQSGGSDFSSITNCNLRRQKNDPINYFIDQSFQSGSVGMHSTRTIHQCHCRCTCHSKKENKNKRD